MADIFPPQPNTYLLLRTYTIKVMANRTEINGEVSTYRSSTDQGITVMMDNSSPAKLWMWFSSRKVCNY